MWDGVGWGGRAASLLALPRAAPLRFASWLAEASHRQVRPNHRHGAIFGCASHGTHTPGKTRITGACKTRIMGAVGMAQHVLIAKFLAVSPFNARPHPVLPCLVLAPQLLRRRPAPWPTHPPSSRCRSPPPQAWQLSVCQRSRQIRSSCSSCSSLLAEEATSGKGGCSPSPPVRRGFRSRRRLRLRPRPPPAPLHTHPGNSLDLAIARADMPNGSPPAHKGPGAVCCVWPGGSPARHPMGRDGNVLAKRGAGVVVGGGASCAVYVCGGGCGALVLSCFCRLSLR